MDENRYYQQMSKKEVKEETEIDKDVKIAKIEKENTNFKAEIEKLKAENEKLKNKNH